MAEVVGVVEVAGARGTALLAEAAESAGHPLSPVRLLAHPGPTSSGEGPPVTLPRDPARDAARRELSKRMYHDHEPNLVLRSLNRLWDWIQDLFATASGVAPGGGLGLLVLTLVVLALGGLLWWRLGVPRHVTVRTAAPLFGDRPRTAAEHRAAAEAHAAQSHWTQAVQERMRAIVRSLEERALLDPRPGQTAGEIAAEAGTVLPAHAVRLRSAAGDFDDVMYGGRGGDAAMYQRLTALDEDLAGARPLLTEPVTAGGRP